LRREWERQREILWTLQCGEFDVPLTVEKTGEDDGIMVPRIMVQADDKVVYSKVTLDERGNFGNG
jgi:hypothetical protein